MKFAPSRNTIMPLSSPTLSSSTFAPGNTMHWFAVRPIYNRDTSLRQMLENHGIHYIIPSQIREAKKELAQTECGTEFRHAYYDPILVANAAARIYFIYASRTEIGQIRKQLFNDGYIYADSRNDRWTPLVIPYDQLSNFFKCLSIDDKYFICADKPDVFSKKEKVRIVGDKRYGGLTGVICRIADSKRLIVRIEGAGLAIVTEYIPQAYVRKINAGDSSSTSLPCMAIAELALLLRMLPFAINRQTTSTLQLASMLRTFLVARKLSNLGDEHFYHLRIAMENSELNRLVSQTTASLVRSLQTSTDAVPSEPTLHLCYQCLEMMTTEEAHALRTQISAKESSPCTQPSSTQPIASPQADSPIEKAHHICTSLLTVR